MKFGHKILEALGYHTMKTGGLYLARSPNDTGLWQTDTKTELS